MPQQQTSSPSATGSWWHEVSKAARVAFVCSLPIAFGLVIWEAVHDDSLGPEHPLSIARLIQLRIARHFEKQQRGLCIKCGYDLGATLDRCPECGAVPAKTWRPALLADA